MLRKSDFERNFSYLFSDKMLNDGEVTFTHFFAVLNIQQIIVIATISNSFFVSNKIRPA